MNPRQRRGVLLLLATGVAAIVVFVTVTIFVSDVNSKVGPYAPVLRLTADVQELQPVTAEMLEVAQIPERWITDGAVRSPEDVVGKVASGAYPAGSTLQAGMVIDPPGLQPGYREVAIIVDAETGVAGKVTPGDRVDIIATTPETELQRARAEVWVESALVLELGLPQTVEGGVGVGGAFEEGTGVPITFALPVDQALRLAYAESFSTKLRLALRGRGDEAALSPEARLYEEAGVVAP